MKKILKLLQVALFATFFPWYVNAQQLSVHDMFKDYTESELIEMMEKGQQFIDDLQKNGTPEEKEAFEKAMEDTLKNFSQEDWQEFQEIVDVVKDKVPPMPEQQWKPEPIKPKTTDTKTTKKKGKEKEVVNSTLKKMIININKKVKSILQKAQSDKMLHEEITTKWSQRDNFNEMLRKIMVLNQDKHLTKLDKATDEETKALVESLKNFNARINQEDKIFQIADTFGLETDPKTSRINLAKLNRVLEFFNSGVTSLDPKVTGFIKKYEPEALKKAEELSQLEKDALNFTKKNQKVPGGGAVSSSTRRNQQGHVPSSSHYGSNYGRYGGGYPNYNYGRRSSRNNRYNSATPQNNNGKDSKKNETFTQEANKPTNQQKESKDITPYEEAKNAIEGYIDAFDSKDIKQYTDFMQDALDGYKDVDFSLARAHAQKMNDLNIYHIKLEDTAKLINAEFDDMHNAIHTAQSKLPSMNDKEFDEFKQLTALKKIKERHALYSQLYKNFSFAAGAQFTSRITFILNRAEQQEYKTLHEKIMKLHGIQNKVEATNALIDNLSRYIKKEQKKRSRKKSKSSSSARRYA